MKSSLIDSSQRLANANTHRKMPSITIREILIIPGGHHHSPTVGMAERRGKAGEEEQADPQLKTEQLRPGSLFQLFAQK